MSRTNLSQTGPKAGSPFRRALRSCALLALALLLAVPFISMVPVVQGQVAPVADAGPDQSVPFGSTVALSASATTNETPIVNYTWTFEYDSLPTELYGENVTWTFALAGNYSVTLNVTDSDGLWDTDVVLVTVREQMDPPVANAGPDQSVPWETEVTLNASGTTSQAPIVNYTWTFEYGQLPRKYYGESFKFIFAESGEFNITLNVTDTEGNWDTDTVVVTVGAKPIDYVAEYAWIVGLIAVVVAVFVVLWLVVSGRLSFISESTREKTKLLLDRGRQLTKQVVLKSGMGFVGTVVLMFFVLMAIFGPALAPYTLEDKAEEKFMPQSPEHWMGTDHAKMDIFSELLYGARTSMVVGIFSAFIASVLGALVGLYSGYVGGWKDDVIMRANDVVLSIPWLVLMIIIAAFMGKISLTGIILIIGLTGWSYTARMVRAQVLSIKERQYIERAKCIGASDVQIIRRHVFPNTFPLVFANTILTVAVSILSEATLSFLGLRPQGTVTWGTMLSFAQDNNAFHIGLVWWIMAPGLCIVFIVLGFTLLGYALDDALNPKLRKR